MIRAALLVLALTGSATAGAWEEFEQRCLVPMENVELDQPVDLTPSGNYKNDGDTFSEYELSGGSILAVSDGRGGRAFWCRLSNFPWSKSEADASFKWMQNVVPAGRYNAFAAEHLDAPLLFESTTWREPRIEISIYGAELGQSAKFLVRETDLES